MSTYGTPEYIAEQAQKEIQKLVDKVHEAEKKAKTIVVGQSIQPVQQYPMLDARTVPQIPDVTSSYYSPKPANYNPNPYGEVYEGSTLLARRQKLDECYQASLKLKDANQAAVVTNCAVYLAAMAFMKELGVKDTVYEKKSSRSSTMVTRTAPWVHMLEMSIPRHDYWPEVERTYNDLQKKLDRWQLDINKRKAAAEEAKQLEAAKLAEVQGLGALAAKYHATLPITREELQVVIAKSVPLLAVYHFEYALSRGIVPALLDELSLAIEQQTNVELENELNEIIVAAHARTVDGRIFRDCKWNYRVVRAMLEANPTMETILEEYDSLSTPTPNEDRYYYGEVH